MANIKKTNPKSMSNHVDFRKDEPKTLPLSVDAEVLKFIKNPQRNQGLTLEGIVDTLFESGLHEDRQEIEKTVLRLISEGYITQHGDNIFELADKGESYLDDGKKIAKESKKIEHKASMTKPKSKTKLSNKATA